MIFIQSFTASCSICICPYHSLIFKITSSFEYKGIFLGNLITEYSIILVILQKFLYIILNVTHQQLMLIYLPFACSKYMRTLLLLTFLMWNNNLLLLNVALHLLLCSDMLIESVCAVIFGFTAVFRANFKFIMRVMGSTTYYISSLIWLYCLWHIPTIHHQIMSIRMLRGESMRIVSATI